MYYMYMFYRCTNMLNGQVFAYSQNKCNYDVRGNPTDKECTCF